ncbi:transcription cofactor vestigial-like protein 2 [Mytilus galloprovincialis]|uniref:transcription cofactor vestigial-like protein 2 n=1 Tax=Mytilus edulis TaxID=6550 RepID=UPI0039F0DF79
MYQFYSPYFSHKSSSNEFSKIGSSGIYDYHLSGDYLTSNHSTTSELERDLHSGLDSETERPKSSQYIAPNCVLFNYFSGDVSTVVDDHFSRALSQPSSFTLDKCNTGDRKPEKPLMCQRKMPSSFWNSNHKRTSPYGSSCGLDYRDPYFPPSWYTLQNNHWPYSFPRHHAHSELGQNFTYSSLDTAGKLGTPYQSLMFPPGYESRQNKYDFTKNMESLSSPSNYYGLSRFGMDLATKGNIDSTVSGLEYQLQSARREMCW